MSNPDEVEEFIEGQKCRIAFKKEGIAVIECDEATPEEPAQLELNPQDMDNMKRVSRTLTTDGLGESELED